MGSHCHDYPLRLSYGRGLDGSSMAGKLLPANMAPHTPDVLMPHVPQYGPEIAPLRYRHLGGASGTLGEWSMTYVTVFGGGIALQRVSYEIWYWQLFSCVLACVCKCCPLRLPSFHSQGKLPRCRTAVLMVFDK